MRLLLAVAGIVACGVVAPAQSSRAVVVAAARQIQRADYEGDRAALERLADTLTPFVADPDLGSRVLYWRGFARWRRAMNGAQAAAISDMEADLSRAADDFHQSALRDPTFVEARATEAFCLVNVAALSGPSSERARSLFRPAMTQFAEALAAAPENPRVLWMHGSNQFYQPSAIGGGEALALATYQRGLDLARRQVKHGPDTLEPEWGEPELLMSLAFASLHQAHPDVSAAQRYADQALERVPYWHYVRDVLMVEIRTARARHP